jgi:plasmid replication initiation protein
MAKDAMKKPEIWEPERLAVFLGCAPGIRMDHLKSRVIEPAITEINDAANFSLIPNYVREPNTHGRAIKSIQFGIVDLSAETVMKLRAAA